jgi:hypothetical protein
VGSAPTAAEKRACFTAVATVVCVQVVQHSWRVLSEGGEGVVLQQVSVRVEVKPGQLEGTRYVFEG